MDLSVLVEARNEYIDQLTNLMGPRVILVLDKLYSEANTLSKGKKVLLKFQALLKEVPNWNEKMTDDHTREITDSCAWFNDLMAAAFVSYVKILSSIRLNNNGQKVSIKLPTNKIFVQSVYNAMAEDIYNDPYIFTEVISDREKNNALNERLKGCIDRVIKSLAPIQDILKAYMSVPADTSTVEVEVNDQDFEDTEDPDVNDEPENIAEPDETPMDAPPMENEGPLPDEQPPVDGEMPPDAPVEAADEQIPEMTADDVPPAPPEDDTAEETKNIAVGKFKDDELFPDAPEK